MTPTDCPTAAELADFHDGRLADDRIVAIGQHFDTCHYCRSSVVAAPLPSTNDHPPPTHFDREAGCLLARQLTEKIALLGPDIGQTVGDFRLLHELGRGGMGVVYEAEQMSLGRRVAVKVVQTRGTIDADLMRRFEREAKAVGRLHHTNIVPVFGVGEHDGSPFYAMQLIRGVGLNEVIDALARRSRGEAERDTLADRLARPITHREAAGLIAQAAAGVGHAHDQGVLHRDIKPSNLLLDTHGTVWVTDFGLAKTDDAADLTNTGDLLGTLRYMPPEAFDGKADRRSDVYALGLSLYELLARRPAFDASDRGKVVKAILNAAPAPLEVIAPGVPHDLETIVAKATDRDPDRRYPTAHALADDLRRFVRDEPILARRLGPFERLARWAKRNRALAAALAGLAVTLVGVTIGSLVAAGRFREMAKEQTELAASESAARTAADAARDAARRDLYHADTSLALRAADAPGGVDRLAEYCRRWTPTAGEPDLRGWEWRLLHQMADPFRHAIDFPNGAEAVAYSPDGRTLAVGSYGAVVLLVGDSGQLRTELPIGDSMVTSVAWDAAGRRLLVGAVGGMLRVLDATTGRVEFEQRGADPVMTAWDTAGERVAYKTTAGTARIVRLRDGAELAVLNSIRGFGPSALAFAPDGHRFAAVIDYDGTYNRSVRVWDTDHWKPIRTLPPSDVELPTVAWSPDGTRLAAGSVVGTVTVWQADTGAVVRTLESSGHFVADVRWDAAGKRLAAADFGGNVRVWSAATWEPVPGCRGMTGRVSSLSWQPDGTRLAAGGHTKTLRIWPTDELAGDRSFALGKRVANARYLTCAWHPDGRRLTGSSGDTGTLFWDAGGRTGYVNGIEWGWNAAGTLGASGYREGIDVWNPAGAVVAHVELRGQPKWLAWHPTADRMLVRVAGRVFLWEPTIGRPPTQVYGEPNTKDVIDYLPGGGDPAWNPAGTRFAFGTARENGPWSVTVVDPATRAVVQQFAEQPQMIQAVAWSPDGATMAVGRDDPVVALFDPTTGTAIRKLTGHAAAVHAVAYSPDGSRIATGAADGTVKVWDTATGVPVVTFDIGAVVRHVAWSRDGTGLAAAAEDGSVRMWVAGAD